MSVNGLRVIGTAACVVGLLGGCRAVPSGPGGARAGGLADQASREGRPLEPSTGEQSPAFRQAPPSEIRPASAVEPVDGSGGSAAPVVILPSADEEYDAEEKDPGFQLSDLAPENVYKNLKAWAGYGPNEEVARALYKEGEELYRQERYQEAVGRFKAAAGRWPDSTLEEDALFMMGESLFFSDQYPKANDAYGELLKKYEYSRHLDKVVTRLFAIGRYWEQMHAAEPHWPITMNLVDASQPRFDTWGHAIKAYELVSMHDPTGPLADDAIMATANAHFFKGHFEDAAYHYDLLRKEYPKSEHQIAAHLLGMKSKMSMYQGPMYDATPLEEAGQIAEQTLMQFGGELGDKRDLVVQTRNRVVEEEAARDWAMAQYYENRKCYGAARYYYKAILRDYPQTEVALKATARLEAIQDLPDEPPNHFKWLTDLFPSEHE